VVFFFFWAVLEGFSRITSHPLYFFQKAGFFYIRKKKEPQIVLDTKLRNYADV
jgi:hypothetical protein